MTQPLPARVRHGYGVAALSIAVANTALLFFLLKFLVDGARMTPAAAGSVLLVGKLWDAVVDPAIGRLSDRSRGRRPWIAGGALPLAVLFAALWQPLPLEGLAQAGAYAGLLVLYSTSYSAVTVPYGALTPALTQDYDERTRLNAARMGWSMVGGLVAGIAMPLVHQATGSWSVAGGALALLIVPPILVTWWATRGRDPVRQGEDTAFSMRELLGVRAFRRTAILFVTAWSSIAVLSALVPFYVQHHLQHPKLLDAVFAAIQIAALVAIPGVAWLSHRMEKHRAYAVSVAAWAIVLVALALVPPGTGWPVLIVAALCGPGVAAAHVLPWSMLPDVVEADRAASGEDRAGQFYGVLTFLEQAATAVALQGVGLGLEFSGYVEGAASQPEAARLALRLLIGPLPGLVLVGAAIFAWTRPPLTRAEHRSLVEKLSG
ncbi:MAG: MFS transporter [Myxococcota bacterium]